MSRLTVVFGAILVLVGIVGYVATGGASVTALIPAFVGVPMVVAGLLMVRPNLRPVGLYSAMVLALLMALGSLRGIAELFGGEVSGPALTQFALFLASAAYLLAVGREVVGVLRTGSRA